MNLYTSLTLRYLKENKKRTIVTIVGIILSTALICGIANIYNSYMDYQVRETVASKGGFYATFSNIDKKDKDVITKSAGVSKYGFSKNVGTAKLQSENNNLMEIQSYDNNMFESYGLELIEGKLPTKSNEIVVSEAFKSISNEKIGDTLKLQVGKRVTADGNSLSGSLVSEDEQIIDAKTKEYKIVGIIKKPKNEIGKQVLLGFSGFDLNDLKSTETFNISICTNNPKEIYEITKGISKNLGLKTDIKSEEREDDKTYGYNNESDTFYENLSFNEHLLRLLGASSFDNINSTINTLVTLVGSLVIVCTIATVYNAFSISISERKKQFGILNSIGSTRSQISKLVFLEVLVVSIIGIPIGLLAGTVAMDLVFKTVANVFSNSFISELGFRVVLNPKVLIVSGVIVFVTICISAILPAISASKVSPLEAIKNSSNLKVGKVKDSKIIKALFKTEGVLAYKNLRRNKKKFRITLFSLIISVVIFVSFSGFVTLFTKANEIQMGHMNYDLDLWVSEPNDLEKIYNQIKDVEGIENIVYSDDYGINIKLPENKINKNYEDIVKKNLVKSSNGYDMSGIIKLPGEFAINKINLKEGNINKEEAIKENGVIIVSKTYMEELGKKSEIEMTNYKVGDTIKAEVIEFDENGKEIKNKISMKVMAITEDIPMGSYTYNQGGVDIITYKEVGENLELKTIPGGINISTDKKEDTRQVISNICDKYGVSLNDYTEQVKIIEETISSMKIFVYGFIIVISLVSITNIINTISTNINLRKKEFAVIKSIGVTPSGFNKIIYLESLLYGILALLYGLPIGIGLTIVMNKVLSNIISFGLIIPWPAIGICTVGIFIITFVSAYIPMQKINKENIIDNIRQESI